MVGPTFVGRAGANLVFEAKTFKWLAETAVTMAALAVVSIKFRLEFLFASCTDMVLKFSYLKLL
jgi:hypothetical protein